MAKGPKKNVTDKKADPKASKAPKAPKVTAAAKMAAPVKTAAPAAAKTKKTDRTAGQSGVQKAPAKGVTESARAQRKRISAATVTPEQRYRMIQDAAYFIAERNGFVGDNHAYWLEAERAIDAELAAR